MNWSLDIKRCTARLPSWIPDGAAIVNVEVTPTIVHRHTIVAITGDATELGILIETIATSGIANQTETV